MVSLPSPPPSTSFAAVPEIPPQIAVKARTTCAGSGFVPMTWTGGADAASLIRERYGAIARGADPACCAAKPARDYSADELAGLPGGAYLGLGTGNPVREAALRPGETVVDLGSGAGVDVLLAARAVGPGGRAIGVDFTPDMVRAARGNAARAGAANVDIIEAPIERVPVPDATADVVTSNCVVNLSADKPAVLREAFRVLRPGGRLVVSDTLRGAGPPAGPSCDCSAGAMTREEWARLLDEAGFVDVTLHVDEPGGCCGDGTGRVLARARKPVS